MVRGSAAILVRFSVTALVLGVLPRPALGDNPSLCLASDEGCLTPGDIQIQVILGAGDTAVLGGQFTVQYDPGAFSQLKAAPGRACDPTSPFALKIFEDEDRSTGTFRCAFGVDFREGLPPTGVSTTLACLSFTPVGDAADPTSVCLLQGRHPFETQLVDQAGHPLIIDNSQACPPDSPASLLACIEAPDVNCNCVPGTADCQALDNACRTGVCDPRTSSCEAVSVNEGGPCDDRDPCTPDDRCREGTCVGEGCLPSDLCANSRSCLGPVQPLNAELRLRYQRGTPVLAPSGRWADDETSKPSLPP